MKKILIMLGMYQPHPSANGICIEKIIKALTAKGYMVDCIANKTINSQYSEQCNGINIYRIKPRLVYRIFEWCDHNVNRKFVRQVKLFAIMLNKIKLFLFAPIWPVISPLYTKRFFDKAKKLHEDNKYDAVIGVYTPLNSLTAAYMLKKKYPKVKYIPYFLDSLSGGFGPSVFSKNTTIKRGLRIENAILPYADKIICMKSSEEHNRHFHSNIIDRFVFLDIPLLTLQKNSNLGISQKTVKLLYVGTIKKSIRNPEFLLKILCSIYSENIFITFAGTIDCPDMFEKIKAVYGDNIRILGRISHDEAENEIRSADILLNIGNKNSLMVPSKIFEYMSFGKPIISTAPIDNEPSAKYLDFYPYSIVLDEIKNNINEISKKTLEFIKMSKGKRVEYEKLKHIFFLNTSEAFIKEIDKLFE